MHSGNIEDYSFTHGLQKNVVNGKWFPLHPHTLGRALTHDEMDYNLLYSQQTMAGFRIFGQNEDLTLHDNELSKSLIFWKISLDDIDYLRYNDKNYHVGQYIWITPLFDCNDFVITLSSTTKTSLAYPRYVNLTSINNSVDEGGQIVFKLSTKHIPHGTTIGYTITGTASFSSDYQKLGGGLLEINSSSEGARGYVTITGDLTLITLNTTADNLTENNEFLLLTLDPTDSISTVAGLTHSVGINDTSVVPGPTPTLVPVATATPMPTATVVPVPTATPMPTATSVPPTATTIPDPTATSVPPTATTIPDPTATPVPDPTSTTIPDPTSTPVPDPTATELPGSYISLQSAASINEGGVFSFGLKTEDIPLNIGSIGSTTTIGYTITGSANGNDYTIAATATGYQPLANSVGQPLEIIANTPGYTPIQFTIIEDQITEGTETITITLDEYDNFGRETGMLTSTTSINDTSIANPMPTALPDPTPTPVPNAEPTATPVPTAEPTPQPTSGSGSGSGGGTGPTATPVPYAEPTATPVPTLQPTSGSGSGGGTGPTATPVPTETPGGGLGSGILNPTATPIPYTEPTATPVPYAEPTATPVPYAEPTATPVPTETPGGGLGSGILNPTATPVPTLQPTSGSGSGAGAGTIS